MGDSYITKTIELDFDEVLDIICEISASAFEEILDLISKKVTGGSPLLMDITWKIQSPLVLSVTGDITEVNKNR